MLSPKTGKLKVDQRQQLFLLNVLSYMDGHICMLHALRDQIIQRPVSLTPHLY